MNWYDIVGGILIGVATTIILALVGTIKKIVGKYNEDIKAMKKGLQAMLRSKLIDEHNKWMKRGYAPIYAKDNFSNMYDQYETLGENGVMQNIYEEFMELSTTPIENEEKEN